MLRNPLDHPSAMCSVLESTTALVSSEAHFSAASERLCESRLQGHAGMQSRIPLPPHVDRHSAALCACSMENTCTGHACSTVWNVGARADGHSLQQPVIL